MIGVLSQDLRYAARTLSRAPAFTLLAIATMAIGVGAEAAIFSVVNALLLKSLPYPHASDLVVLAENNRVTGVTANDTRPANFLDWRARNHSFTAMAAYVPTSYTVATANEPARVDGAMVSASFFDVVQVQPALGRSFTAADEQPGAPRVAILSDGLWRELFAGRPDALSQIVRLSDEPTTIVGIMPPGVDLPRSRFTHGARLWVPPHWRVPDDPQLPTSDPSRDRTHGYLSVLARLKPEIGLAAANADMTAVAAALERDYPNDNRNAGVAIEALRDNLVANVRSTTLLLFMAVGVLLLIATINVSGLLLARASGRHREIAVRVALGASSGRILAQLLTESVLLALGGGVAGALVAMWVVGSVVALSPADLTVAGEVTVDRSVLLFGIAVSTFAGLLFGLAPARQLTRLCVADDLKRSARGGAGARQQRTRATLVSLEIALSLVLLVAAGLTVRSFVRVQRAPAGFDPDQVVTVTISPPPARYGTQAQRADLWDRTLAALRAIPGIEAAGATSRLPLLPGNSSRALTLVRAPDAGGIPNIAPGADYRTATPDYFRVMRVPVIRGRVFDAADREGRPLVAVVSASAADRFWAGRDPIGERFQIGAPPNGGRDFTIVGVVGDVRAASLEAPPRPTVYVPYRQDAFPFMTFVMRTSAAPAAITADIRAAVRGVDKDQPIGAVLTMDDQMAQSLSRRRFSVTLLTAFGAIAVLLAAVGLYGVLAFVVTQRRREIGVRIALGATNSDVIVEVLGQGARLAAAGTILGIGLALGVTRFLSSTLFGIRPLDITTFAGAATLVAAVAIVASAVPALRATRVDPLVALRDE